MNDRRRQKMRAMGAMLLRDTAGRLSISKVKFVGKMFSMRLHIAPNEDVQAVNVSNDDAETSGDCETDKEED